MKMMKTLLKHVTITLGISLLLLLTSAPVHASQPTQISLPEVQSDARYSSESGHFSEGMAVVKKGSQYGYVDKTGKQVIDFLYDEAFDFHEGMAVVRKGEKWMYINPSGHELFSLQRAEYEYVLSFSEGFAAVRKGTKWGFINDKGKETIPFAYSDVKSFSNGIAAVKNPVKWGFIDKTGRNLIDAQYDDAKSFQEGLAAVKRGDKWGYIDTAGRTVINFLYDEVKDFSEDAAAVQKAGKWGFINRNGQEFIGLQYEAAKDFSDGLAPVKKVSKWGFIDKAGREFIAFTYDWAKSFGEGMALVVQNNMVGYVNRSGQEVIRVQYEQAGEFHGDVALVSKDGKWSILKKPLGITAPAYASAVYSHLAVTLNGEPVKGLEVYTINGSSYFKLRDIAKLAAGTGKKFSVDWNGGKKLISLVSGRDYIDNGTELTGGDGKNKQAVLSNAGLEVNGHDVYLTAYTIGGSNYFKLRELGDALGFSVSWDETTKTIVLKMR